MKGGLCGAAGRPQQRGRTAGKGSSSCVLGGSGFGIAAQHDAGTGAAEVCGRGVHNPCTTCTEQHNSTAAQQQGLPPPAGQVAAPLRKQHQRGLNTSIPNPVSSEMVSMVACE